MHSHLIVNEEGDSSEVVDGLFRNELHNHGFSRARSQCPTCLVRFEGALTAVNVELKQKKRNEFKTAKNIFWHHKKWYFWCQCDHSKIFRDLVAGLESVQDHGEQRQDEWIMTNGPWHTKSSCTIFICDHKRQVVALGKDLGSTKLSMETHK